MGQKRCELDLLCRHPRPIEVLARGGHAGVGGELQRERRRPVPGRGVLDLQLRHSLALSSLDRATVGAAGAAEVGVRRWLGSYYLHGK